MTWCKGSEYTYSTILLVAEQEQGRRTSYFPKISGRIVGEDVAIECTIES
jgi:hypothetical protein